MIPQPSSIPPVPPVAVDAAAEGETRGHLGPRVVKKIIRAHEDDIHGLVRIGPQRFVSGSKDGVIRTWSFRGDAETSPASGAIDYTKWITTLASGPFPDSLIVGTRDGRVALMNHKQEISAALQYTSPETVAGCKERNQNRINCIASDGEKAEFGEQVAFIGTLGKFTLCNFATGAVISECQTHPRDWVYCLHSLSSQRMLAVTGTELEIWQLDRSSWTKVSVIQSQGTPPPRGQRPFISAVTPLMANPDRVGIAVFDGSIRIRDLQTTREIIKYEEHRGRTWAVANIGSSVIATCADDATVKFWDLRASRSLLTLRGFPGRVSSLLSLEEKQLVTTSCPENPRGSRTKAELVFWDVRFLRTSGLPPTTVREEGE